MRIPFFSAIGTADVILLMRNLSMTLRAGVPVTQGLSMFEADARGLRRAVISHLRKTVESGQTLAYAMETSPYTFPPIAVHLVQVGEMSGSLEQNLDTLVDHLRRIQDLQRKIRTAMMYPTFVLVACLGLGLSIGTIVLPQLMPLFESLDVKLPLSTQILMWLAEYFRVYGIVTSVGVTVSLVLLFTISRFETFKPLFHRFFLLIPLIGTVQLKTGIAQFSSALSVLLKSGVAVREALPAVALAVENRIIRRAILDAVPVVEGGSTLVEGLRASGKLFPGMTCSLVAIGEETGSLAETLEYIASYYQGEVDYAIKNLTTTLEPVLLIVIGTLVGFTVMAIITPLYDVTSSIG